MKAYSAMNIDASLEEIESMLGFNPQFVGNNWRSWDWHINDQPCSVTGLMNSDGTYQFLFYGPDWVFEALFLETDESLLSRYE